MERSISQKETQELAVMVDTFEALKLTKAAMKLDGDNINHGLNNGTIKNIS